jgi:hypothetical protein
VAYKTKQKCKDRQTEKGDRGACEEGRMDVFKQRDGEKLGEGEKGD